MAINYASKYAQKIDEKFARESMTSAAVNNDYDFVGVKTVNVYSVPTAEMNDYSVSGTSRYGTPQEIENTVQEMTMTRDRSFTFTIDRGTYNDTQMSNAAGAALQRQIREVVVPEIDKYRFGKICEGAKTTVTGKVTKANAYDAFLTGATTLIENNVPLVGSCAFVSSDFYKNIKEDSSFIRNGDMSQEILIKGQVGTIDGIPLLRLNCRNTKSTIIRRESTAGWLKAECIMTHLCLKIKRVRFMCLKLPNKNRSERLC